MTESAIIAKSAHSLTEVGTFIFAFEFSLHGKITDIKYLIIPLL